MTRSAAPSVVHFYAGLVDHFSTGVDIRLRQRVTKGAGSRTKGLTMAFKLLEMAQNRWRRINGHDKLALVAAGVEFKDGAHEESKEDRAA